MPMPLRTFFWNKPLRTLSEAEVALERRFHEFFYGKWKEGRGTIDTSWMGWRIVKAPSDLWTYQEIVAEHRPTIIIETGTRFGGSAAFFASLLDQVGEGKVLSIDVVREDDWPVHPRIEYLTGRSDDPAILAALREHIGQDDRVMATLDSDHARDNVLTELRLYADLVTPGQYMVCEDTNLNGNPVRPDFGPGPAEALAAFLDENDDFEPDGTRERFLFTTMAGGWLRKAEVRSDQARAVPA